MQQLHFSIAINAPKEKVWQTLWDKNTYSDWANAIDPGHDIENDYHDFKIGTKVRFLHPSGTGTAGIIEEYRPDELITYKTIADLKDGIEQPIDQSGAWAGSKETFTLTEANDMTTVTTTFGVPVAHKEAFEASYPRALQRLKELAERKA